MKSQYSAEEAKAFADDPLAMRVYTSRLLGREPSLVLHGGGNTSAKTTVADFFGEPVDVLYVKGSGWDLATIEPAGFAPVRMDTLLKLAALESLSDADMVKIQRAAMLDPNAPTPSVEAILHALIPYRFVDHTHADAVVALCNTPGGAERVRALYGDDVLLIPYVMPGFVLARDVYNRTRGLDWSRFRGMILLNHGVFTFGDTARDSYEAMIDLVTAAEDELARHHVERHVAKATAAENLPALAALRRAVSEVAGGPMIARLDASETAAGFAGRPDAADIACRGPVTPDHIIRTKRVPVIVGEHPARDVARFREEYMTYFARHATAGLVCLDPAPRWAVWPGYGTVAFGRTTGDADIVADIVRHTRAVIQWAEALGGWQPLGEAELFEMEYWELEQAKFKKPGGAPPLQGKIALVTGAASGIGRACAEELARQGAAVAALDIAREIADLFRPPKALGIVCDVTDDDAISAAVDAAVRAFGGLDILVSNAGTFPPSATLETLEDDCWAASLEINLSSHLRLLRAAIPYLKHGIDAAVVVIGSKNVPAPGPGAAAYSAAKAGLTQLARVAALEWGSYGIRVNVIHPNAVFDTAIWTDEILTSRARQYGLSVDEYKTNNVLKVEVRSRDVAAMVCAMVGPAFAKTTGAQVPVDGGNDRVI